jgi:hypothetical protein
MRRSNVFLFNRPPQGNITPESTRDATSDATSVATSVATRDTTKQRGDEGEDAALRHLLAHGLRLVARNYRTPGRGGGEIDLILQDTDGTTVFVEVRKRAATRAAKRSLPAHPSYGGAASASSSSGASFLPPTTTSCACRNGRHAALTWSRSTARPSPGSKQLLMQADLNPGRFDAK